MQYPYMSLLYKLNESSINSWIGSIKQTIIFKDFRTRKYHSKLHCTYSHIFLHASLFVVHSLCMFLYLFYLYSIIQSIHVEQWKKQVYHSTTWIRFNGMNMDKFSIQSLFLASESNTSLAYKTKSDGRPCYYRPF